VEHRPRSRYLARVYTYDIFSASPQSVLGISSACPRAQLGEPHIPLTHASLKSSLSEPPSTLRRHHQMSTLVNVTRVLDNRDDMEAKLNDPRRFGSGGVEECPALLS